MANWTPEQLEANYQDGLYKERAAAACRAAGITNVEALGALLVKGKALADGWPHCDGSHGDCEMCDFRAAYRALYAPQASEAKPL